MNAKAPAGSLRQLGSRVARFGRLVRFSHTIFALPFALAGVLFGIHARGSLPHPMVWIWVVVAMVGARSAAMAFNRIVDARIDAANPRTRDREIPQGTVSPAAAWGFTGLSVALFVVACWRINGAALALSPLALAIVFFYSFTKRFTWTSHLFLGLALAVAPVGGWVAVNGRLDAAPFLLALVVLAWVAGFDTLYALQDVDFDRRSGLHSLPARFGPAGAVRAARACHAVAFLAMVAVQPVLRLSPWYLAGLVPIAGLLVYEHSLVRPDDLSRLGRAFFDMNAVVSLLYLGAAALGVFPT
jgi:4-hydroxybenzoate polyprenyltransferase